ncbi:mannose-specific lectin-like [Nymphaea colorata]|uniref:mannose-specific lectin-like n=1 Tax=Nymphaea colorata TaxID=210225 RepID=UPI00129D27E5|nr:mannose-specific lectin-like [Nymphaea colorata]
MVAQVVAKAILFSQAAAEDLLFSGQTLFAGRFKENGPYKLIMQYNCNLVLYINGNRALWASGTAGKGSNCSATVQPYRETPTFVYPGTNARWASGTASGQSNYVLIVQYDRNVVIYKSFPCVMSFRTFKVLDVWPEK